MLGIGLGDADLPGEDPEGVGGAFEANGHIPRGVLGSLRKPCSVPVTVKPLAPGISRRRVFPWATGRPLSAPGCPGRRETSVPGTGRWDHAAGGALQAHFDGSIGHGSIPPLVVGCITFKHTAKCGRLQGEQGAKPRAFRGRSPKKGGKAGPYPAKTPGFFSQHHHPTNSKGNWEEMGNPMHFPQKNKK